MRLNTKVGLMSVFETGTKQITNPYKYSVHLSIIYNLSVKYYSSKRNDLAKTYEVIILNYCLKENRNCYWKASTPYFISRCLFFWLLNNLRLAVSCTWFIMCWHWFIMIRFDCFFREGKFIRGFGTRDHNRLKILLR